MGSIDKVVEALNETGNKDATKFAKAMEKGKPCVFSISPDLATIIRTACGGRNRNVAIQHATRLSNAMKNGEWQLNGDTISFYNNGLLFDGQHRLYAVTESGTTIDTLVAFNFDETAQSTKDQQARKRSAEDSLRFEGHENADIKGFVITNYLKYTTNGKFSGAGPTNTAVCSQATNYSKQLDAAIGKAEKCMEESNNKIYNVKKAALWFFLVSLKTPQNKDTAESVFMEIITGTSEKENSPGLMASNVLIKILKTSAKSLPKMNLNVLIGTTARAFNFTISGMATTEPAVMFPSKNKKGEQMPVLS